MRRMGAEMREAVIQIGRYSVAAMPRRNILRTIDEQARRHDVKPGITGWAQVNGRNTLSWEDKFTYDVWYGDNISLWLDIKILFLTVKKVFIKEGISAEGEATIAKFSGTESTK